MTQEQIEELRKSIETIKGSCNETEALIADYSKCESEVAKKYLSVAIKKHGSMIPGIKIPE